MLRFPLPSPRLLDSLVIVGSVLLCLMLLLARIPGTQIAQIGVNWVLIWVVSWSIRRDMLQGAIAGLVLGLILDGMSAPHPTHVWGLVLVGVLTGLLQKQRYIQEDFISVALLVFGMVVLVETVTALQLTVLVQRGVDLVQDGMAHWQPLSEAAQVTSAALPLVDQLANAPQSGDSTPQGYSIGEIWIQHQRVALSSAIVSSLWAPVVSWPLNRWWDWLDQQEDRV